MDEICDRVATELRALGFNAVSWDSGGGMVGVGIARGDSPPDELTFFFGTAGASWEGEVLDDAGENVGSMTTSVDADSDDPRAIAAAIAQAIARLAAEQLTA